MSDNNNSGGTQGNSTGYSADYVKELRDEAAGWRTKLRETEDKLNKLQADIDSKNKQNTIQDVLSKKGMTGINPKWIEIGDGMTPEQAVDKFVKDYPHLFTQKPSDDFTSKDTGTPRSNYRPMVPNYDNSNVENTDKSELKAIKKDPIARSKLRDHYRSLLNKSSGGSF